MIAIGTKLGTIEFFDISSRNIMGTSATSGGTPVEFIDFSPNGKFIISVKSGIVEILNLSDPKHLVPKILTTGMQGKVTSVDINEQDNIALTAKKDSQIKFFNNNLGVIPRPLGRKI